MATTSKEPKRSDYDSDDDGLIAYARAHKRWKKAEDARRERERKAKQKKREDALILRYLASNASERERIVQCATEWRVDRARTKTETEVQDDAQTLSVEAQDWSVTS